MKHLLLSCILLLFANNLMAQGWGEIQKIVSADRSIGDLFGWSVDMDGDYAVIGARGGGPTGAFRGTAYVFKKDSNGVWNEVDQLTNIDNSNSDEYGYSVAISGDYIFIGAIGQDYIGNGTGNYMSAGGAVYVYKNNGSDNWDEVQKIVASDREMGNRFGFSLAIHNNYAVIGTYIQDYDAAGSNFLEDAGAAYIFERDGSGTWNEVQKIVASDRAAFDYFGRYGIAIDGDFLIVGAYLEDEDVAGTNTASSAGSAYVFERNGSGTWNELQKIVASNREQSEWFGKSVDISGNTIAVGAEREHLAKNTSTEYGAVYTFERNGSGVWNEVQKIRPSYLEHQSKFGQSVSIDGNHIIVGAFRADIGSIADGGAAFMFEKNGSGIWNEVAVMYDDNAGNADNFGFDVAISGNQALVGAYQEDEDETEMNPLAEAGSAYIFDVNEPNSLNPLSTLSVVDSGFDINYKIYPNPTHGEFHIDLKVFHKKVDISIVNILGQNILKQTYHSTSQIHLNFKDFENGFYLLNLKTNKTLLQTFKIIKE